MTNPPPSPETPSVKFVPYERIGGEAQVRALTERFYDVMEEHEPELARLHELEDGRVSRNARERFALFMIGWLGGPQHYMQRYGHPRLRMRHAHVPIDMRLRDAWVRCMNRALNETVADLELRSFLEQRLADVANFLRNRAG